MSWRDHIKVHPAADLFPMMSESELRELGEDIKENGQRVQVVLWKDPSPGGEYWLIDRRNRLAAARPQAKKPRPKPEPEPEPVEYRATGREEVDIEQRRAEYAAPDAEPPRPVTDLDSRIIRAAGAIRHEAMGPTRSDTERFSAAVRDQIASIEREVLQDADAAPSDLAALPADLSIPDFLRRTA
jgi:hypothetical protein